MLTSNSGYARYQYNINMYQYKNQVIRNNYVFENE